MKPVLYNRPEPMTKVKVITLQDYAEETLKTLHRIGVLHVEKAEELKPVDRAAIENQQREIVELRSFVNNMMGYIIEKEEVSLGDDVEVIYTRPFNEVIKEVRTLYADFAEISDKASRIDAEVNEITKDGSYLGALTPYMDARLKDLHFSGDYLFSRVFIVPSEVYQSIHGELGKYLFESTAFEVENQTVVYALGKMSDLERVESITGSDGGELILLPDDDMTLRDFLSRNEVRLAELEKKRTELFERLNSQSKEELRRIVLLRGVLIAENQRLSVLAKAAEAKYVNLIEGWVPDSELDALISDLRTKIEYVFIDTRKPEPSEEPPTKMNNASGIKPFQTIVNLFATPKYREWDPTPIVAYSFATFFGLMIADVGYAVGLILFAKFLLGKILGNADSEGFKSLQKLIYISSGVALALGLLAGNYFGDLYVFFGFENLGLSVGVQSLLQTPITFVILSIFIGWIHVNIAHITALVKSVKEKNTGATINRVGLLVIQFGAFWLLRILMNIDIPHVLDKIMYFPTPPETFYTAAMYGTIAGVILIVFGAFKERGGIGALLGVFDITGLLGDVMSYSRLAGVGLATFYLGSAFNMLAKVLSGMIPVSGVAGVIIGGILAVLIIVAGHVINLLLGFLTGFVHSLRLCFVEFLIKFYEGGGLFYSPFRLRKRASMLIGEKITKATAKAS